MKQHISDDEVARMAGVSVEAVQAVKQCADIAVQHFQADHPTVGLTPEQWDSLRTRVFSAIVGILMAGADDDRRNDRVTH